MPLTNGTIFTIRSAATTGNVNGAGFNPANANMLTNLTTDTNTANTTAPIVSSASYNFVAGDVGHWVYIQAGTNWTAGWYKIDSVAANKATLNGTIGAAQVISRGFKAPSTVVGCATVGTPTGGTFTIDYSQANAAIVNNLSDGTSAASTTFTSATAGFTNVMVGNLIGLRGGAGATTGWYEIVSFTNSTTVVLDAVSGTYTLGNFYVGGAGRYNGLEDAFGEVLPAGAHVWIEGASAASYTVSAAVSIASANGTAALPIWYCGYNTIMGDDPRTTNRPTFACGANLLTYGAYNRFSNIIFTGTGTIVLATLVTSYLRYCKIINTSSTASRVAISSNEAPMFGCEIISQNGTGESAPTRGTRVGCYYHDSTSGYNAAVGVMTFINCIFASFGTSAITATGTGGGTSYHNCIFYGRASTPTGIGINFTGACPNNRFFNNVISGFATGILVTTTNQLSNNGAYNTFFNNTTNATLYTLDPTDIALDPQFTNIAEVAFSNGTITGGTAVLTIAGADLSGVVAGTDFCRITAVTGGTGTFIANYLITAVDNIAKTVTFNNNAGSSGSATNVTGYIPTGHNYNRSGNNLKAAGYPGVFPGSDTTQYLDIGLQGLDSGGAGGNVGVGFAG